MPRFGFPFNRKESAPPGKRDAVAFLRLDATTDLPTFLGWVSARLPTGEALVAVTDLASTKRGFETRPTDPSAELVACAAPRHLRGSLTTTTRYYRVPLENLRALETHSERGVFSHAYEVFLRPLLRGRAPTPLPTTV